MSEEYNVNRMGKEKLRQYAIQLENKLTQQAALKPMRRGIIPASVSREWLAAQEVLGNSVIVGATGKTYSLPTRWFNPAEVVDFIDEHTEQIFDFIGEWGDGDYSKLLEYSAELRDMLADVLGYVRRTEGKLVRRENTKQGPVYHYPFTDDEMGRIIALTLQTLNVMARMEIPRDSVKELDNLLEMGEAVGLALADLLGNRNDGTSLRDVAAVYKPPSGAILNWIELRKPGPKPSDNAKQVRAWLRLALINANRGDKSQADAYKDVKDDLEARAGQLTDLERGAYLWLQTQEEDPKADPCGTLWRDIRRQKNPPAGKEIRTN